MKATSADISAALRKRYPPEAYALMFEVGDATGARHSRWADAVAMSLWPSRGLTLSGFEFKVSRTDWLKELRTPQKAEAIARFCAEWWLVVSDESIVAPGELPAAWGLMALNEKGSLVVICKPIVREPEAITPHFLAALLRAATKPAVAAEKATDTKAYRDGYRAAKDAAEKDRERERRDYDELRRAVAQFEDHSGIKIGHRWGASGRVIGEAVARVLRCDRFPDGELAKIAAAGQSIADAAKAEMAAIQAIRDAAEAQKQELSP